jgi:hypothetical protein
MALYLVVRKPDNIEKQETKLPATEANPQIAPLSIPWSVYKSGTAEDHVTGVAFLDDRVVFGPCSRK